MAVDRSTIIQNAQRFMARGQIDKAIEEWQKLVSLTPQDGNLYNTIGDLYLKKNDSRHAVEIFMLAAAAFERAGFALKTIAVYKKVLKVDPANLAVNLKLADLNAERGLTGNAIEDYLKVAKEYGRQGKVQEALGIYRKIANFDPTNTNIRLKLAELSLREKLVDESIDEYMKVAQMYAQNGRAADAAAIYKKILEINPKHAGARDAMKAGVTPSAAQALPTVAEVEEAVAAEDWGLAGQKVGVLLLHEPTNLTLRGLRGKILLHKGEVALAWGDYRLLVEEAARAGQADTGITLLREYLATAPQQAEPRELFAKLLDQAGRTDEALAAYAALIDVMIKDGLDEGEIRDHFSRMKELDSTSDITRRYQARFEPSPEAAGSVEQEPAAPEVIAEPVALEPADAEAVAEAVELPQDQPLAAPEPLAADAAEPSVSAGRSKPSVEPAAPEPSISISRLVGTSQSLSRESVAPPPRKSRESAPPPPPPAAKSAAPVAGREPSISASRQTGGSQSRSRETSAPPGQKKRLRPRDLPDYFAEAEVYLKYGLASKAIEQFQMILSVDPNNIEAHAKLRELFQLEGRLEEAVTHSVVLARLYHARGQREQAEQTLAEAREWNPADPRLQAALDEQGPLGQPALSSAEGAGLEPQDAAAQRPKQDLQEWLAEAEFYLQQGLDDQAHQLFETIRQHYPDAPEVAAYFEARQVSHPSQSKPKTAAPRKLEAQALGDGLDDLADALNQSATGSAAVRDDASLSAKLADLFPGAFRGVADGDAPADDRLAASVEGVIRGVEQGGQPISPDGPDPHYSLGLAYKEMGLYAEARKEFEQTLQLPAYRIDAAVMMAACHQAEGQPRQAIRQLQECLGWLDDSDPKWLKVAYELAALYAEVGDQEQALTQVQCVLDVDAGYEPATALLARLRESPAMKEKEPERPKAKPPKGGEPPAAGQRADKTKRQRISYV